MPHLLRGGQYLYGDPTPGDEILSGPPTFALWDAVRATRAPLLVEADHQWNKAADLGAGTVAISAYRQALRDVTGQTDPLAVEWPIKPWL